MGSKGTDHTTPLIRLGIPVPTALWIRATAHQPVEFHQPGGTDGPRSEQAISLHEQRDCPVFVIHSHREASGNCQPLQLPGLIGMQGDRLLQQQMFAGFKSTARQLKPWCRGGRNHHSLHSRVSQQSVPVDKTGETVS